MIARSILQPALVALLVVLGTNLAVAADSEDGKNRRVIVRNDSSLTIDNFYASRVSVDNWEEDILGNRTIPPGNEMTINVDDGTGYCHYDFKAILSDGQSVERRDVNVCTAEVWTISDDD